MNPADFEKLGLGPLLLLPSTDEYAARQASYWSTNNAALRPACILKPQTAVDVSRILKAISRTDIKFAVRGGGSTPWAGSNNIVDGVTIDLGALNEIKYDPQTKTASAQPGANWQTVIREMEKHVVQVAAARDPAVGVGGFLTGGGNSYIAGRVGLGCDTVVNFEVVLADGRIVNANASEYADLWKGLKGGWSNFGIVTRFDIETVAGSDMWAARRIHDISMVDKAVSAFVNFGERSHTAPQAAHLLATGYNMSGPQEHTLVTFAVDTEGNPSPSVFAELLALPATSELIGPTKPSALVEVSGYSGGRRAFWLTTTFKNDTSILKKALSLHEQLITDIKELASDRYFATSCVLQPIPSYFGEIGARKGGNVLGLDTTKSNAVLCLFTIDVDDVLMEVPVRSVAAKSMNELEMFAKSRGGEMSWRYINYADKSQNPLTSYGAKNIEFMEQVARKYDPGQLFQRQQPGSHTLSGAHR